MAKPDANRTWDFTNVAVIVAHPDDETLWAGGTILMRPETRWTIITLCRASDLDRAPKFRRALEEMRATGAMGDLDDSPEQPPLQDRDIQKTILSLLPSNKYDIVITHSRWGEYTRHLRHEQTAKAVLALRETGRLQTKQLWSFAYEDGGGRYLPRAVRNADVQVWLTDEIWNRKYSIITNIYDFDPDSFEAKTTPRQEAFYCFGSR